MTIEFSKSVVTGGTSQSLHRYEPDDEPFRNRRLDAFDVATSTLNSRLIFDAMVAVEGCLGGRGILVCFTGSRALTFQQGLGRLFLDLRPAGAGLVNRAPYVPEFSVTVFGAICPEGIAGVSVPCLRAAAWTYVNHGTGVFGRRMIEGHLPAFPVD